MGGTLAELTFGEVASFVILLATLGGVIWGAIRPMVHLTNRVTKVEEKAADLEKECKQENRLDKIEKATECNADGFAAICACMLELLNDRISGGDNMEGMKKARTKLQAFLIEQSK